jgi:folylpolyglutamate synthase/dihydropteroate synthase
VTVATAMGVMAEQIDDVATAVQRAIDVSTEDDVILIAGSLYVAGAARTALQRRAASND